MPFSREPSGSGHVDITNNPEFHQFIEQCEPVAPPDDFTREKLLARFQPYPKEPDRDAKPPESIMGLDGSPYSSQVRKEFPSIQVLFLKTAAVLVDIAKISQLREQVQRTIDPVEVNRMREQETALTFWFNGANLTPKGARSPKDGFRRCLYDNFTQESTRLAGRTLLDALYDASRLHNARHEVEERYPVYDSSDDAILLYRCGEKGCSNEDGTPIAKLPRGTVSVTCPACEANLYATDVLRLHEAFNEAQDNQGVLGRASLAIEHLLLFHTLTHVYNGAPRLLGRVGFVMDGGLAIFGESAKFHRALMAQIALCTDKCAELGVLPPVIFGIQKHGEVLDFARSLDARQPVEKQIPKGSYFIVPDDLRYSLISPRPEKYRNSTYGGDTHYGQDVIVKTHAGRIFALSMAYPYPVKAAGTAHDNRFDPATYPALMRTLSTLELVQSGLYGDSTVPQMLAHHFASISHVPGGRVLDVIAQRAILG